MPTRHLKVVHPSDDKGSIFPTDINSSPTDLSALLNAIALHDLSKQGPALFQFMKTLQSWHDWQKYMEYNEIRRSTSEIEKHFAQVSAGEEVAPLDWQEKYLDKIDRDIGEMKESLRETEERIANMIDRSLAEMRDRDNQRHQEMLTLISEINAIKNDNLETRRWIIGMVISAIGVSLAAIIGMLSIAF